jgi:prepilin-type N-terminal cleavage/methylation domain-containing protein
MRTRGYTLIEILVVLTVIGILFSVGFASYRDFSRRQALAGMVKQIQGDLRMAQQMALSGVKPEACTSSLDGVMFTVAHESPDVYRIRADCGSTPLIKEAYLPGDITYTIISGPNPIIFKVLGQGTNISSGNAVIRFTQSETGNYLDVTVESGGAIK